MLLEFHCASDPFPCVMPVCVCVYGSFFFPGNFGTCDEYLNFQAGIFPCQVVLLVGMFRDRTGSGHSFGAGWVTGCGRACCGGISCQ